jgi:hypothetical protein
VRLGYRLSFSYDYYLSPGWPSAALPPLSAAMALIMSLHPCLYPSAQPVVSRVTSCLRWMEPEGPHSVQNIDEHRYHAIRIKLK